MKKFLSIIEGYKIALEQGGDPVDQNAVDPAPETSPAEPEANTPDVPAGIATMGSLLKKALTMKISDDDRYKISKLPEINEKNADQVIDQIVAIMKTYSADIDIDNNVNTSL